jgi:hypothetical protein
MHMPTYFTRQPVARHQARYCSKGCQTSDWKAGHKAACGAGAGGAAEAAAGMCTRCLQPNDGRSRCRVSHPVRDREDCGGMFSGGRSVSSFFCAACRQSFSFVTTMADDGTESPQTIEGARWCYDGRHSAAALPASDRRRVIPHTVELEAGPGLQAQLDSLPADVETLTVTSAMYDDSRAFTLAKRLPKLQTLKLIDVCFSKVLLTAETTPALRSLQLQNVPDACDLQVVCAELRDVSLHYWRADGKPQVLDNMLRAATKLERFDSYKLWSNAQLRFASPALTSIDLHRADSLRSLSIWAPNLTSLRLQGCYSLQAIEFPAAHPLAAALPAGYVCSKPLRVVSENANLGAVAASALRAHPRAVKARDAHAGPMAATESMFAGMHGGGGDDW